MKKPVTTCKECGSTDLSWDTFNKTRGDIAQGRLNSNDVTCLFVLGCNHCSETLATVPADKVAASMNQSAAAALTNDQIAAGAAVVGDHGQSVGRNTAMMVFDAMTATAPAVAAAPLDLRDLGRLFAEAEESGRPVTLPASACATLLAAMTTPASTPDRKTVLLTAAHTLLKKQAWTSAALNLLHESVHYDGTECDGLCLVSDIEDELELDGDARPE